MVRVGHALLGAHGEVLSLDDGLCAILGRPAEAVVGRSVLDVTVPADRMTCATLMRRLAATREPFHVTKRYLRGDGSEIWVSNTVSIIALGDAPPMLVATIMPIDPPGTAREPAAMLDCARFMLACRRERGGVFDTAIFAEPSWDMMLTAYVAEAEGRVLDIATLADAAALSMGTASRWVRALLQEGLLERESGDGDDAKTAYRATARAHAQFEAYLSGLLDRCSSGPDAA